MKDLLVKNSKKSFFFENKLDLKSNTSMNDCFSCFDHSNKGYLDINDFSALLKALFWEKTQPTLAEVKQIFSSFDKNGDEKIDCLEFEDCWSKWIKKLLKPVTALLVIDVQNDFIDGSLAIRNCPAKQEATEIIPVINSLVGKYQFDVVVYSLDQHPENHISFIENVNKYQMCDEEKRSEIKLFDTVTFAGPPKMEQKLWPTHCVENTWGAKLHPNLKIVDDAIFVSKGTKSEIDSYSAFYDNMKLSQTKLHDELQKRSVTHVFVCGLAYDICVAFTALDSVYLGYATSVFEDASRGTDLTNIEKQSMELKNNSGVVINSLELEDIIKGKDVRLEFAKVLLKHIS